MNFLLLLPVILSFLVLAAHFLRGEHYLLVGILLSMPFLLLIRRRWVIRVIQVVLLLGAFEWLWTMVNLIDARQDEGLPWIRMAIILGSVMVFTVASGLVFMAPPLRRRLSNMESCPESRGFQIIAPENETGT